MGFYVRKSISAGPFRFNLSKSGVGLSVGVTGFRIGTGPRGNYIHMGRGGLYYRASLVDHSASRSAASAPVIPAMLPNSPVSGADFASPIETGNVLEMKPANGSDILEQINEKLRLSKLWPWVIVFGVGLSILINLRPGSAKFALIALLISLVLAALQARYDKLRKTVVIMYDLDDDAVATFKELASEFDKLSGAAKIWNVDTTGQTSDWKRNAGANQLLTRKPAHLTYGVPSVIKTNIDIPSIVGGKQSIHFFPDVALVVDGNQVGAISYDQLRVTWKNSTFIEDEGVPVDSEIIGYTWRFVNKKGGPDRRFGNNRQIPKVIYQEMSLQGAGFLQKILQFSRVIDHNKFDAALVGLRAFVGNLPRLALNSQQENELKEAKTTLHAVRDTKIQENAKNTSENFGTYSEEARRLVREKPDLWEYRLTVEILRMRMMPVFDRWRELQANKYKNALAAVPAEQMADWCQRRFNELQEISSDFTKLVNEALQVSWGPPGEPGDAEQIRQVCESMAVCAQRIVQWEETVRFTPVPWEFREARDMLPGIAGRILEQLKNIYQELCKIFQQEKPVGNFNLSFVIDLPDGWANSFVTKMQAAMLSSH